MPFAGTPIKLKTILAVALIVLGVVAFAYQILTYTHPDREMTVGSLHLSTGHEQSLPLTAILGALALIGGVALLLVDKSDFKPTPTR